VRCMTIALPTSIQIICTPLTLTFDYNFYA
jgi:hypothetical protein